MHLYLRFVSCSLPFALPHALRAVHGNSMHAHCCCSQCSNTTRASSIVIAGPKLGLWVVIPCQLIVMIGLDIVYCVTAGKAMQYVYQHTCNGYQTHSCTSFGLSVWIVIFAIIQMLLSMVSCNKCSLCRLTGLCCCLHRQKPLILLSQMLSSSSSKLLEMK